MEEIKPQQELTLLALLTGKSADLFDYQMKAYEVLGELERRSRNVRTVAVLGVYHSSTRGPSKYAFVNPGTGQTLFEDSSTWDPRFRNLWRSAPLKWVEPLRMSPLGVWNNILRRCGAGGTGIIRNFSAGISVNTRGLFPMKPKSFDYAHQIVTRRFWR